MFQFFARLGHGTDPTMRDSSNIPTYLSKLACGTLDLLKTMSGINAVHVLNGIYILLAQKSVCRQQETQLQLGERVPKMQWNISI